VSGGGLVAGLAFASLTAFHHSDAIFVLLPVFLSLATGQPRRYNLRALLASTPAYLALTAGLVLAYYATATAVDLVIHQSPTISHTVLIATALAWAVILDPPRAYLQGLIERRFYLRDREAARAVAAFTATLREEIDLDQLRERFVAVVQQTLRPHSVALWTRAPDAEGRPPGATEVAADGVTVAEGDPLVAYVLGHPGVQEVERLPPDSPALRALKRQGAELIAPLASQGELLGLLIVGPQPRGEPYDDEQRTLLDGLAAQVAPALRVAQMVREEQARVREHAHIEQELRTARTIQHSFLPREVPALPGWELVPYYRPAREVGGDFYDFLPFDDGRVGIVIGDVTGKGVPAALVMATTHTMLRGAVRGTDSPAEVLGRVNALLAAEIPAGMFVTCFCALLDPATGRLRYANAGHEPPYRRHDGDVTQLWASGMPLGMMPATAYDDDETTLAPGEGLLFYSDGLVEAHDRDRAMFGFPRLQRALAEPAAESSPIAAALDALGRFTGDGWEQEDDVTLVALRRERAAPTDAAAPSVPAAVLESP
jgi:serine phosphatase RsbU (regulator of sigma subunit)